MFAYLIVANLPFLKAFGLRPEYAVILFFFSLFFIGMTFLPPRLTREYIVSWLLFASFMVTSLGGGMAFVSAIVFSVAPNSPIILVGALSFFVGIAAMIISSMVSTDFRSPDDVGGMIKAFKEVTDKLGFLCEDKSAIDKLVWVAKGNLPIGTVELFLQNGFRRGFGRRKKIASPSMSTITIDLLTECSPFRVNIVNEAIEMVGLSDSKKVIISEIIKEKNLGYFNMALSCDNRKICLSIDGTIEESDLWLDYIYLIEEILEVN